MSKLTHQYKPGDILAHDITEVKIIFCGKKDHGFTTELSYDVVACKDLLETGEVYTVNAHLFDDEFTLWHKIGFQPLRKRTHVNF